MVVESRIKRYKCLGLGITVFGFCLLLGGCAGVPDKESERDDHVTHDTRQSPSKGTLFEEDRPYDLTYRGREETAVQDTGPLEISVEDAVFQGLASNLDLQVQLLQPVITGSFESIERSQFDPELFLNAQTAEERITQTARATGEQFNVFGTDRSVDAGIRQSYSTGTDLELSVSQSRSDSDRTPEQQTARVGLSLTQALLRGFGPSVNLASVRQRELDTLSSVWELRGYTESLVAEIEISYWQFVLAREEIAIFQSSLDLARQQQKDVEQRIEVGSLSKNQAAAVRAEVASREQALIDARSNLEERRLRLARLINPQRRDNLSVEIIPDSDLDLEPEPIEDVAERIELGKRARPDLNQAWLQLDRNELQTIRTQNGLLPRLDLFMNLGRSGFATTIENSLSNLDSGNYDFTAGVRFSTFLGNREAQARDLAARANRQQARESVENLSQLTELDIHLAANEVERVRQQIAASAATRKLREQTVEAENERFQVGASTALQVAQAQRDLLESRIAEVDAMIGYRVALIELYLAEGSLLQRRGISLNPRRILQ